MDDGHNFPNATAASERFFRLYVSHCTQPNEDTLFSLLEACHSLSDRLRNDVEIDFHDIPEYVALKALRNFFHHQNEMIHRVNLIPTGNYPIVTDLMSMCLVPRDIIDAAIDGVTARHRDGARSACEAVFHWYGQIVNINPAIFNCTVKIFEALADRSVPVAGDAWTAFNSSYQFEEENGHAHYIDGRISTAAGSVDAVLSDIIHSANAAT
jgi:hypothetical protein